MKLYRAIVFFFAVSLFMGAMNALNITSTSLPTQNLNTSSALIEEITQTSSTSGAESAGFFSDIWGGAKSIARGIMFFKDTALSVLDISNWLDDYGVPKPVIDMFYGMLLLITIYGLIKFITGRSDKGID